MQNTMHVMIQLLVPVVCSLWEKVWQSRNSDGSSHAHGQALPTTAPHVECTKFLKEAQLRSLNAVLSWTEDPEILAHKEHFLSSLPLISEEKFKHYTSIQAVRGLLNLHRGEVVEVPTHNTNRWTLACMHGIDMKDAFPEQFQKGPDFRPRKLNNADNNLIKMLLLKTLLQHRLKERGIDRNALQPDWKNQKNRLWVPCQGTTEFAWLRSGNVITLGELFHTLHHKYTCREIYQLYLHLDVVAVKWKKDPPKGIKRQNEETS